jgi:hypothetical protein
LKLLLQQRCKPSGNDAEKASSNKISNQIFIWRSHPMKTIHTIFTATCCLLVIILISELIAGERRKAIEMADGKMVTFLMSPEEMAAEDAVKANLGMRRSSIIGKARERVVTYEMGEGGHMISFPMTEKEIEAEDALHARQEAQRAAHTRRPEPEFERIELAESGLYIMFPITNK